MARHIDCENCYHGKVCAERHIYHDMIVSCPHHIPAADVVEVVRCENCKFLEHTRNHIPYCKRMDDYINGDMLYEVSYDDF